MTDLGPQYQNLSYGGLLQIPGGVTAVLQQVQDGDGNPTGLYLSSTGVSFTGLVATTAQNLNGGSAGYIPYQSAANTTAFVGAGSSGYVLVSNGSSAPSWSNTAPHSLTSNATTNLAGGSAGTVPYQSSAGVTSYTATGSVGQVLTSTGLGAPVWQTISSGNASNITGGSAGNLVYQIASNTTSFVSNGTSGQILQSNGAAAPNWTTLTPASIGALAINGSNNMSGNLNMSGYAVTNLAAPSSPSDAATKYYVDSLATGLNIKSSCLAATTANITLSGAQMIDGVPITTGDRVFVKNQTNQAENGIYVGNVGAWTRATDADTWSEIVSATAFVSYGAVNASTTWVCNVSAGGTLGVTPITVVQFAGSTSYSAGTGLVLAGTQFRLDYPVVVPLGGTGVTSLSGIAYGNGSSAFTAATGAQIVSAIGSSAVTNATNSSICTGNSATATKLETARLINGVAFDGTTNITIPSNTPYSLGFASDGTGSPPGSTFNGSSPTFISYNSIGAPSTTGAYASGTWSINISGNAATATSAASWSAAGANTYTTNNVGINTSTPACSLDVVGKIRSSGTFDPNNTNWTNAAFTAQGGYGGGIALIDGSHGWALWADYLGANLNIGQGSVTGGLSTKFNFNSAGALALNGNYGTSGQVLTSSGGGAMTWSNPSASGNGWTTGTEFSNGTPTTFSTSMVINGYTGLWGYGTAPQYTEEPSSTGNAQYLSSADFGSKGMYSFGFDASSTFIGGFKARIGSGAIVSMSALGGSSVNVTIQTVSSLPATTSWNSQAVYYSGSIYIWNDIPANGEPRGWTAITSSTLNGTRAYIYNTVGTTGLNGHWWTVTAVSGATITLSISGTGGSFSYGGTITWLMGTHRYDGISEWDVSTWINNQWVTTGYFNWQTEANATNYDVATGFVIGASLGKATSSSTVVGPPRIYASGTGYLGLGTWTPATFFDVCPDAGGSGSPWFTFPANSFISGTFRYPFATNGAGAAIRATNGFQANIPTYTFWYDDYTGIGHPANQQINILISATEVAKFTYSGLLVNNLAGSGNRAVYSDSSGYLTNTSSDISLKTNINQLSDSLNKTKQLRGVSFNWKNTVKMGEQTEIGFIAQEVQDIVPEVIGTNFDGTLSLDYPKLTALIVESIKEIITRLEALESKINQ